MSKKKTSLDQILQRLAEITKAMEAEDSNLEKQIALYEEGMKLLQSAKETLAHAETKIKQINQSMEALPE